MDKFFPEFLPHRNDSSTQRVASSQHTEIIQNAFAMVVRVSLIVLDAKARRNHIPVKAANRS